MSVSAIFYLLQTYWPFLLIAAVIGIATGWYSQVEGEGKEGTH
ncbi:hypothetical protein [Pelagibacterium sediminicola]|nr:hypothetical protein [Pelagibacterium sediminicola]